MKKAKIFFILMILVSGLIFHGCTEDENSHKTEVVFWHAMGGPLGDVMIEMIDEFNGLHEDIHINAEFMGNYGALSQRLMASAQVQNSPTISQAYEAWTDNFIQAELLKPLSNFIKKDQIDIDDFFPAMINSNTFEGKIYSFPFNKSMQVMYVNLDILEKFDINEIPSTYDELIKVYETLHQNEQMGTAFSAKDSWTLFNMILQRGGRLTDEAETRGYFDSKANIESLKFMRSIIENDYGFLTQNHDHQTEFIREQVAIIIASSVSKVFMEDSITFNWASAPLPEAEKKASILSGTNIVMFDNNPDNCTPEQQEAAWKFIKWFTAAEQTARWSINTNYMPVRYSALETDLMQNHLKQDDFLEAALVQLDYAAYEPKSSNWYDARMDIADIMEKAFIEEKSAEVYAKEMNKAVNKALQGD
ncbi:MAG: ABC transporter substrate-binding protein [Candidatus Muiribacteriota bacterium]